MVDCGSEPWKKWEGMVFRWKHGWLRINMDSWGWEGLWRPSNPAPLLLLCEPPLPTPHTQIRIPYRTIRNLLEHIHNFGKYLILLYRFDSLKCLLFIEQKSRSQFAL